MTRYVLSDLHLGHGNIIDHCDRPFESEIEMNETLVENWNTVVSAGDTVVNLGDLAMWGPDAAVEWAERLNGSMLLIPGNHDDLDIDRMPCHVVDSCTLSHGKYTFECVHRPEHASEDAEWTLYGHVHNNDVREFPFIDPQRNRVNVSADVMEFTPLSFDRLTTFLDRKTRYETVADAMS